MSRLATLYDEQQQPVGLYTRKSRESDLLHHFIVGQSGGGGSLKDFFFLRFFLLKLQWKVYNIQNSKTVFL